jgi:hypothetical protein
MRRCVPGALPLLFCACSTMTAGCFEGRSELSDLPPGFDAGSDAAPPEAGPPPVTTSDKVDLLLVIDNSPNTDDFQALFAATEPYLLGRFAQPACVNGLGNVVATTPSPTDPCPDGQREFKPITDVHVGVITTSLGGHGGDVCSPTNVYYNPTQNDAGHLITRGPGGTTVSTYQGLGFLVWDPDQKATPPGETNVDVLGQQLGSITTGAGELGCGFESHFESMYRFLADPEPYASIPVVNGSATPTGTDTAVLQERAEFLRPDSALVVVIISDEDDCSIREGGQYFYAAQSLVPGDPSQIFLFPRARSECAQNPDDPCCDSCGSPTPAGCSPTQSDPSCLMGPLTETEDPINLRCFNEKQRFGIDFLYPVQRYVDALTLPTVTLRDGSAAPNPIFAGGRSPELVMLAGIVGVPWQDIATTSTVLGSGYLPGDQIDWSLVIGDPATGTPPGDPLMIKSIAPRTGMNPPTGYALEPPTAGPLANPINGHERDIPNQDDLQYACIYARPDPVDCSGAVSCNCIAPDIETNPTCQAPDGSYAGTALFARALPSTRDLTVLQGLGNRAAVASICAQVTSGTTAPTFGYKPAVDAILKTLRPRVQ